MVEVDVDVEGGLTSDHGLLGQHTHGDATEVASAETIHIWIQQENVIHRLSSLHFTPLNAAL